MLIRLNETKITKVWIGRKIRLVLHLKVLGILLKSLQVQAEKQQ